MQQNRLATILVLTALLGLSQSGVMAEQESRNFYRAPSSFAGKTIVLPIGTCFEGRIQSTIGSRASHSGQSFTVEVSAPVMANGTEVLIPSGSEVTGEVAEAISSSSQPHDKNMYAPMGILRVQITGLKLPDGQSYPLVASLAPDGARGRRGAAPTRKNTVAYVGTQAGFDAVNPALQPRNPRSGNGKMAVLKRGDMMSDPIYGDSQATQNNSSGQIRALIRKGRDLMILSGSSLTIRLDGPLKMTMGASSTQNATESAAAEEPAPTSKSSGKHFAKSRPAAPAEAAHSAPTDAMAQPDPAPQAQQPVANTQPARQQPLPLQQPYIPTAPGQQPGTEF